MAKPSSQWERSALLVRHDRLTALPFFFFLFQLKATSERGRAGGWIWGWYGMEEGEYEETDKGSLLQRLTCRNVLRDIWLCNLWKLLALLCAPLGLNENLTTYRSTQIVSWTRLYNFSLDFILYTPAYIHFIWYFIGWGFFPFFKSFFVSVFSCNF